MPRADLLLVTRGLADSRTRAQRLIAAGRVSADGRRIDKPATELPANAALVVTPDPDDRFVSRGGLKLAGALARTGLDVTGQTWLDIGQSTGGFSDCLLQAGAAQVVGVEVGHGQLHPRLQPHPQLVCLEGLNARHLTLSELAPHAPMTGFAGLVCDASFISLTQLMPRWRDLLAPGGLILSLVKPQFEVGPEYLGKGGLVRDPARYAVVEAALRQATQDAGLDLLDWFDSPITGADGNHEFFLYARKTV